MQEGEGSAFQNAACGYVATGVTARGCPGCDLNPGEVLNLYFHKGFKCYSGMEENQVAVPDSGACQVLVGASPGMEGGLFLHDTQFSKMSYPNGASPSIWGTPRIWMCHELQLSLNFMTAFFVRLCNG